MSAILRIAGTLLLLWFVSTPIHAVQLPPLPEPVTNNAVASVHQKGETFIVSMMGLAMGKSHEDVHNKVWRLKVGDTHWIAGQPVPSSLPLKGRLASVAVGVAGSVYLFGGYTVAADHSEISSPDNYRYDPAADSYNRIAPTPVPVDDAVAFTYQDRFIYLVSGWHNDGNVNLVQVYDVTSDQWSQASPLPGLGVFGNAGGIVGNRLLVCDGVVVEAQSQTRRKFSPSPTCYYGAIDKNNVNKIAWFSQSHPTGVARYRMAAAGVEALSAIVFIGGSDNPYNYNGVGYNGVPSEPDTNIWLFDVVSRQWKVTKGSSMTMDHRGLVEIGDALYTIGGIGQKQKVLNQNHATPFSSLKERVR